MQSVQPECLDRVILFSEAHLRRVLSEYVAHYHAERPHQGIGNELVSARLSASTDDVVETERLGGLLRSHQRTA